MSTYPLDCYQDVPPPPAGTGSYGGLQEKSFNISHFLTNRVPPLPPQNEIQLPSRFLFIWFLCWGKPRHGIQRNWKLNILAFTGEDRKSFSPHLLAFRSCIQAEPAWPACDLCLRIKSHCLIRAEKKVHKRFVDYSFFSFLSTHSQLCQNDLAFWNKNGSKVKKTTSKTDTSYIVVTVWVSNL